MPETILVNTDAQGVATITLNRPEIRNAFNEVMIAELDAAFDALGKDPKVRLVILTGAGSAFSAGADLNWMKKMAGYSEVENQADARKLATMLDRLDRMPKPTMALVNGPAMGGAVGLVSCCDIAVARESARFALSEVRLGLIPATISPYVVRAIGVRYARRYFVTGELIDSQMAKKIGLVHHFVADDTDLRAKSMHFVQDILKGGPEAIAHAKDLIFAVAGHDITPDLLDDTASRIAERRVSAEGQEGLSAFLEKRKSSWTGA